MSKADLSQGPGAASDRRTISRTADAEKASMNRRNQLLCAWSGVLILTVFGVGLLLAGYLPPPQADDTTQQVVQFYSHHTDRLRAGLILMMLAGGFWASFSSAIALQLKRIEGRAGALTYTQLAAGAATTVVVTIGAMVMTAAAFRPERNPEVTQALHDLGWLLFTVYMSSFLVQTLAIGTAIVGGGQTVYPRWVGYVNFWIALGALPAVLATFFKSGPFAWHGIFVYWLTLLVLFIWFVVMTVSTVRAIKQDNSGEPV